MPASQVMAQSPGTQDDRASPDIAHVLRGEEAARARILFRSFLMLAIAVELFVPFLDGAIPLRVAVELITAAGGLLCFVAIRTLYDERLYTPLRATLIGVGCSIVGV